MLLEQKQKVLSSVVDATITFVIIVILNILNAIVKLIVLIVDIRYVIILTVIGFKVAP